MQLIQRGGGGIISDTSSLVTVALFVAAPPLIAFDVATFFNSHLNFDFARAVLYFALGIIVMFGFEPGVIALAPIGMSIVYGVKYARQPGKEARPPIGMND